MTTKSEKRRIRRGRQPSVQQGQGHGPRTIVHVKRTNWMPAFERRHKGKLEIVHADVMRVLRKAAKRK